MNTEKETLEILDQILSDTSDEPVWIAALGRLEENIQTLRNAIDALAELGADLEITGEAPAHVLESIQELRGRLNAIHEELDGEHDNLVEAAPAETIVDMERLKELENDLLWSEVRKEIVRPDAGINTPENNRNQANKTRAKTPSLFERIARKRAQH